MSKKIFTILDDIKVDSPVVFYLRRENYANQFFKPNFQRSM